MNATAFFRIVWKEYRTQRAGWTAIAATIVFFSLALLVDPWITPDKRTPYLFCAAVTLAALYALVSSVTLFATECENGTFDFLQATPVGRWTVFFGKMAFSIGSAAVMFAFAWTLALVLSGGMPDPRENRLIWTYCGLTAVEFWAWGMFFSLLTKRTVVAATLAGTVTALVLSWLWNKDKSPVEAISGRLVIVSAVTALDLVLARRWLRERRAPAAPAVGSTAMRSNRVSATALGRLGRLVWQDARQSAVVTAAILIALAPLVLNVWIERITAIDYDHEIKSNVVYPIFIVLMLAGALSPVLLGSTIFLGDQTGHHFRFLAERGVSPRLVWLSRHLRGLAVLLSGLILVLLPEISYGNPRVLESHLELIVYQLCGAVVAYACGQFCSMIFRSSILAATFGAILTVLVCGWAAVVSVFGMSWWWTVAPLIVAFLTATWLHALDWFLERKGWRVWLRPVLVIVVPAFIILAAIPIVRIYEIPWVEPGFNLMEFSRPASPVEQKARAFYTAAIELQKSRLTTGVPGGMTQNDLEAEAVSLAVEASRYPLPGFSPDLEENDRWDGMDWEIRLAGAVFDSGKKLQAERKLDAALDRFLAADHIALHAWQRWGLPWPPFGLEIRIGEQLTYWASERGQTSAQVLKAMHAFERQWRNSPTSCDDLKFSYFLTRRGLEGDAWHGPYPPYYRLSQFLPIARWLPWERARAVRVLNKLNAEDIVLCREFDSAMAAGRATPSQDRDPYSLQKSIDRFTYEYVRDAEWPYRIKQFADYDRYRRATLLVLAIEAWKLDHGSLPNSLDQLKGKYLEQLPIDPLNGGEFGYQPKGLSVAMKFQINNGEGRAIEPGQPFIGLPWKVTYRNLQEYGGVDVNDGPPPVIKGGWGWVFPIPTSGGTPRTVLLKWQVPM
jgi:hypothetical protein